MASILQELCPLCIHRLWFLQRSCMLDIISYCADKEIETQNNNLPKVSLPKSPFSFYNTIIWCKNTSVFLFIFSIRK